jgi:hypothetical protein
MVSPYTHGVRLRESTCLFCNPDGLEQGYNRDFYIIITRPTDQLINGRVLTCCDCMFATHTSCWLSYCDSPLYTGCPICNREIPSIKQKKTKGLLTNLRWEHSKQFCILFTRLSIILLFILGVTVYFGFHIGRQNVLRESPETP